MSQTGPTLHSDVEIKDIARQAGAIFTEYPPLNSSEPPHVLIELWDQHLESFAKKVAQECSKACTGDFGSAAAITTHFSIGSDYSYPMDSNIKAIAQKARARISKRNLMSNPVQVMESIELRDDCILKFAKLIAQECMTICGSDSVSAGAIAGKFEIALGSGAAKCPDFYENQKETLMPQITAKSCPILSIPDNWDAFNQCEIRPRLITRENAASILRRARNHQTTNQATVKKEGAHKYRVTGLDTAIIDARPAPDLIAENKSTPAQPKKIMRP